MAESTKEFAIVFTIKHVSDSFRKLHGEFSNPTLHEAKSKVGQKV